MNKKDHQKKRRLNRRYDASFKASALRLVEEGRSVPSVAKSLGMQEHLPGRILKRALAKISEGFQEVGIDLEEVRELSLDTA